MIDRAKLERVCLEVLRPVFDSSPGAALAAAPDDGHAAFRAALVPSALGLMKVPRGVDELEAIIGWTGEDGQIPPSPGDPRPALPLISSLTRNLYFAMLVHRPELGDRLRRLVPRLERFHDQLHRRCRAGLYPTGSPLLRDGPADGAILDVGFNALLVQAEADLGDLTFHAGGTAQALIVRRAARARAMLSKLWRDERRLFTSRDGSAWIEPAGAGSLLSLYAGVASPAQARLIAGRHLRPGSGYWTPFPLSTVPREDSTYRPDAVGRGAVSPVMSWLVLSGLYRYGFDELARQAAEATERLILEHGPREAYDAESGAGLGPDGDLLTAAVGLHLSRAPYDVIKVSHF